MNPERICYGCFEEKEPGTVCPHCGFNENEEQPYLALPLGTLLNGRYMVGKVLGVGGFGITYLSYDLTLEIKVAIKEYMPSSIATRNADRYNVTLTGRVQEDYSYGMDRFLDEAKILAKLQNTPNIVSVQNYFKENNTAYFVMEYVEGMSLKSYLSKQGGKISYTQAAAILQPIMEAMVQVHALNLLHRDISPDNIYITSRGESRLLDFGAARFAFGDGRSVSVILKHGYAPEEQYSSHGNQGPWTDVYAMGATMYRCITGILPPDSVERMHGDSMKTPSELGVNIPREAEQALLKALAVKPEDRFPNMEAFINALGGSVPEQSRADAGVTRQTQTPSFGQTVYAGTGTEVKKARGFSKIISFLKANPIAAVISGGGILAVIALCIILPIVLSGGGKTAPSGGGGGDSGIGNQPIINMPTETSASTEEPSATQSQSPTVSPSQTEARDLGMLNASINVPSDYRVSSDGYTFINDDSGCIVITGFIWNAGVPIYTLTDVEDNRYLIISSVMTGIDVSDYSILSAGYDSLGSQQAYKICFQGTGSNGVTMDMIFLAMQGNNAFGCYSLLGAYPKGDSACAEEINEIIYSFKGDSQPDIDYSMWYSESAGLKIIIDDTAALGGVWETEVPLSNGTAYVMEIYPTEAAMEAGMNNTDAADAGGIQVGFTSDLGYSSPEELLDANANTAQSAGGTVGERYTVVMGGADWICQDYIMNSYHFSSAAAYIDGTCIYLSAMYNSSNQETVISLCNQVLVSVRTL